jgi:hypothetical protein
MPRVAKDHHGAIQLAAQLCAPRLIFPAGLAKPRLRKAASKENGKNQGTAA